MLVLRKEIKIGIGAGLAILVIAGAYGLMASLSGGSKDPAAQVATDAGADHDPLKDAQSGLPPVDTEKTEPAPKPLPLVFKAPDSSQGDPFAESKRTDGNAKTDIWSSALTTGKITGDVSPVSTKSNGGSTAGSTLGTVPSYRAPIATKSDAGKGDLGNGLVDPKRLPVDPMAFSQTRETSSKSAPVAGGSKYKIEPGDTFSTIASKVYGSKKYFGVLVKANPDINPARMKVGHEITVPPKESLASVGGAIETSAAKLTAPIDASRQYRIAPGDTLSRIAGKLYGKSAMWQAIYEANKTAIGPDEARLKVGSVLTLPEKPVR